MPSTTNPSSPRGNEPGAPITDRYIKRVAEAIVQRQLGAGGIQVKRFGTRIVVDGSRVAASVAAGQRRWTGIVEEVEQLSTNRWEYTVTQAFPKAPIGYTLVGSDAELYRVTVTNCLEDNNAESGLLGTGMLAEDIPEGFALQPIPALIVPIEVFGEELPDGSIRWRTRFWNDVTGQCVEPTETDSTSLQLTVGTN